MLQVVGEELEDEIFRIDPQVVGREQVYQSVEWYISDQVFALTLVG